MNRRAALTAIGTTIGIALLPLRAIANDRDVSAAIVSVFGDRPARRGRITLALPKLAESGNSVPITVKIQSPMSRTERVLRACIFANRNPRPLIATMAFGPLAGSATFTTNIRLNGTQDVIVIAEMNDHSLWKSEARVLVTVGACDAMQTRY
jgi:sulfur-oxidizing protein SoxY